MNQNRCLQIRHEFPPALGKSYIQLPFEVLPDTEYIIIRGHYAIAQKDQNKQNGSVDIGLADTQQQIRGWSGNLNRHAQIVLGEEQASYGYLAGPLQVGTWHILLGDSRAHNASITVELELELRTRCPRILRGDIHGHSFYSDGVHSIETKLQMAQENGLDFLALSDHNSVSQNFCLPINPDILLLPSCEITTYNGHLNIFGYKERRIPNFMCNNSEQLRAWLCELKQQQGIYFQLNHPVRAGDIAGCWWNWSYDMPFDWIEVWNGHWNPNSVENVKIWQSLLAQEKFLPAVANSDFHVAKNHKHGYPCNNVWAGKKTQKEVLVALAKGHNYLTAEPLPHRNFAAQCRLAANGEFVPFGSAIREGVSVVLQLSVYQSYLEWLLDGLKSQGTQGTALLLRAWSQLGLCLEREIKMTDFENDDIAAPDCSNFLVNPAETAGHYRKFSLQLDAGLFSTTLELAGSALEAGAGSLQIETDTTETFQRQNLAPRFLRFELFHRKADDTETALLLTNPIFYQ